MLTESSYPTTSSWQQGESSTRSESASSPRTRPALTPRLARGPSPRAMGRLISKPDWGTPPAKQQHRVEHHHTQKDARADSSVPSQRP